MTKIDKFITFFKIIWGPLFLICLTISVLLLIACQFLYFTDPGEYGYSIWNEGECKDKNSTDEIDDCALIRASSVISIIFGVLFLVFSALYLFGYKDIKKLEIKSYAGIAVISGLIYIPFQILTTIKVRQQMKGNVSEQRDIFAWYLLITSTIVSCLTIAFNPITIKYISYLSKNMYEAISEATAKKTSTVAVEPFKPGKKLVLPAGLNPFAGMIR